MRPLMICPKCGATMNQHAEKLVDPRNNEEDRGMDSLLGGVILEMHQCPGCGAEAVRMVG